jgi:hypothetical protein
MNSGGHSNEAFTGSCATQIPCQESIDSGKQLGTEPQRN